MPRGDSPHWRARTEADWFAHREMVCGPASRPCPAKSLRSQTISSAVLSGIARGEVIGRRDRGSNAASPSARYRATSRETQPWDTLGHAVLAGYLPLGTALGNDSGDDQARFRHPLTVTAGVFLCLETRHSYVLRLDTTPSALRS